MCIIEMCDRFGYCQKPMDAVVEQVEEELFCDIERGRAVVSPTDIDLVIISDLLFSGRKGQGPFHDGVRIYHLEVEALASDAAGIGCR